jgi:hypothetical protein
MTYDNIIATSWDNTTFKEKLQQQWRVIISNNSVTGGVDASDNMFDFTHTGIQERFEEAYENCRSQLAAQGNIITGQTITSGQYGVLEHKPSKTGKGKSYALRIPNSGMKKVLREANSTFNDLFEVQ